MLSLSAFFAAQAVEQHRNAHFAKGFGGKALCQGIPGGSHQTGVERSAHLERDAPAGTGLLCKLCSLVHCGLFAANDQLARAIVVADLHTAQRGCLLTAFCKGTRSRFSTAVMPQSMPLAASAMALPR